MRSPGTNAARRPSIATLTAGGSMAGAVALVLVLGLGLILRLLDLGRPFYGYHMWNEVYYATIARNLDHFGWLNPHNYDWSGGGELGQRHGPPPFVPWLINLSFHLFGQREVAARLPMLALGMVSLLAIYGIARELYDRQVGLLACALAAVMPGVVFMSRQVAQDSPMVAFGLASVWSLLRARRHPRLDWPAIGASSLLLGAAVFSKFTGVLFVPILAWIWLGIIRRDGGSRAAGRWLLAGAYFLIAALPALAWMIRGFLAPAGGSGGDGHASTAYLLRTWEWAPHRFRRALYSVWARTSQQTGQILWYPLVIAVALSLPSRGGRSLLRRHLEVVLLVLPWFFQLVYPVSWYENDAYTYPALYGMAVLLAVVIQKVAREARGLLGGSDRRALTSAVLIAAIVLFSSLSDYRQYYRSWYKDRDFALNLTLQLPANLVTPEDPFVSARSVRSSNVSHAPILADTPATIYYAQEEDWRGKAVWYWWPRADELDALVSAIRSLQYAYVVFTYQPPPLAVQALCETGYRRIAPGAWLSPNGP